jgi:precorrin-3B synthase
MTERVRGWCPSLFEPMGSGDGLLTRVKPPLGRLSADAARALAAAARRFGNGQLELTNRGGLQVRGLSEPSLRPFQDAMLAAGLAHADPAVERRRNLVVSPLASPEGLALAVALEQWIAVDPMLAALPSKFGFAVETSGRDIGLTPDAGGWRIRLEGCATEGLTATPLACVQTITHRLLSLAAERAEPPGRMAAQVQRLGPEAVFAGTDARLVEALAASPTPPIAGRLGPASFALGLPFGAFTAEELSKAASLADRFADGELRTSPWRALVLAGISDEAGLAAAAQAAGFLIDPRDNRLSVTACTGAPGCGGAYAPTRRDAAVLAAQRLRGRLHLSGCAKGCAHPISADFTLVAAADGYGLVRDGRAGDPPERRGLTLQDAVRLLAAEPIDLP